MMSLVMVQETKKRGTGSYGLAGKAPHKYTSCFVDTSFDKFQRDFKVVGMIST